MFMPRQISINDPHYIPTLYRERLIELVSDDMKETDWLRMPFGDDELDYLFHYLDDVRDAWLKACYQEGLLFLDELRFFLGLADNVPSIVGGEAPYMENILDMEVVE